MVPRLTRRTLFPYTTLFRSVVETLRRSVSTLEISIEPGRFIVADAGALVAQVQATKHSYGRRIVTTDRSEEHTSELQSRENLVCRLLLEKKNNRDRAEPETL